MWSPTWLKKPSAATLEALRNIEGTIRMRVIS